MMFKQGQEVRDAADPNRIGIVVRTGSSLGDRVLWCFDESLTWTSERPVVTPARAPVDVLNNPEPGDRIEWQDGEVWTVTGRETQILHDVTPPDGGGRAYGDRMILDVWADPMDDGDGSPFTCIPHDVPPPAA